MEHQIYLTVQIYVGRQFQQKGGKKNELKKILEMFTNYVNIQVKEQWNTANFPSPTTHFSPK